MDRGGRHRDSRPRHPERRQVHEAEGSLLNAPIPQFADVKSQRPRARKPIETGAVTPGYAANLATVLALLNDALATEIVCVLRYRRHHFMARHAKSTPDQFLIHANEEMEHADLLAERIVQLGGEPDFAPDTLAKRSHAQYVAGSSLPDMIREDLVAERTAIDGYRDFITYLADKDPTTSDLLKGILAVEEEHATELADLLPGAEPK